MEIAMNKIKHISKMFYKKSFNDFLNKIIALMEVFAVLIFVESCSPLHPTVEQAYCVMGQHATLEEKKGFKCCGFGGSIPKQVEELSLEYEFNKRVELNEARKMILELVDELIYMANHAKNLRPHMVNYPFDEENVHIAIYFYDQFQRHYPSPFIARVSMTKKRIFYSETNPVDPYFFSNENILVETVEEARAALREAQ